VSLSIILSFLIFFLANFPANKVIDRRGMRVSLCLGTGFYFLGTFLYLLINKSYNFVVLGTFFIGLGQPFILNLPAKVAAFWFFPRNVLHTLHRGQ
jgi:MFS family permease